MERIDQQLEFINELHKLKAVMRRNRMPGFERKEDTAEHSWHVALMAAVLSEQSNQPIDVLKTITMLLIHDVVEIDAGDTYVYDEVGKQSQSAREDAARDRIFGLLPADQAQRFIALWDEFEARETPEAKFAKALDRISPLLANAANGGLSWREHGVNADQVRGVNCIIADGSEALWAVAQQTINKQVALGQLAPGKDDPRPGDK